MARKLIQGKDVLLYEVIDGDDYLIVCSDSCTITKTWEVIEATHWSSDAKEFTTGMYEWGVSLSTVLTLDLSGSEKGFFDFFDGGLHAIKMTFTDGTNTKTVTGSVVVPEISAEGSVAAFSKGSLTMKGTGELTIA